jgi:hypothetical protein
MPSFRVRVRVGRLRKMAIDHPPSGRQTVGWARQQRNAQSWPGTYVGRASARKVELWVGRMGVRRDIGGCGGMSAAGRSASTDGEPGESPRRSRAGGQVVHPPRANSAKGDHGVSAPGMPMHDPPVSVVFVVEGRTHEFSVEFDPEYTHRRPPHFPVKFRFGSTDRGRSRPSRTQRCARPTRRDSRMSESGRRSTGRLPKWPRRAPRAVCPRGPPEPEASCPRSGEGPGTHEPRLLSDTPLRRYPSCSSWTCPKGR